MSRRAALKSGFRASRDTCIQIVGEAVQWEQVLTLTQAMLPDVVLFDGTLTANLPEHSAVELAVRICRTGVRGLFVFAPAGSAVEEPFLFHLYVNIKPSPLDKGLEQAYTCFSELLNTLRKGYFFHPARPIEKARTS